jgi:transcriptional regulator with XRE-family HTH domain
MNSEERLLKKLLRPRYRDAFIAANVGVQIATQLHALRISRRKSQDKLADDIGMNQATISQMEKPEYRKYNIGSLIRFAQYYKVALDVRFVSITDHVKRILNQTSDALVPPSFDELFATPSPQLLKPVQQETRVSQDARSVAPRKQRIKRPKQQNSDLMELMDEVLNGGIV